MKEKLFYFKNSITGKYKQSNSKFYTITYSVISSNDVKDNLNILKKNILMHHIYVMLIDYLMALQF